MRQAGQRILSFHAILPNLFEQLIFVRKLSGASRQRCFAGSAGIEHFRQMRDAAEAGAASDAAAEFIQSETRSVIRKGEIGRKGDAGTRGGADDHPQTSGGKLDIVNS